MQSTYIDSDETQKLRQVALPIRWAGGVTLRIPGQQPIEVPLVQLDASERREVEILWEKAHLSSTTKHNAFSHLYMKEPGKEGLLVRIAHPISGDMLCAVFLPWPEYDPLFELIIATEVLYFTTHELAHTAQASIGIRVRRKDLARSLAQWRSNAAHERSMTMSA